MKKQIAEVQNYFINKITACEFDSYKIGPKSIHGFYWINAKIDGCRFEIAVNPETDSIIQHQSDFNISIPNDRLRNLLELIETHKEKTKAEKIEKLKAELAELEPKV